MCTCTHRESTGKSSVKIPTSKKALEPPSYAIVSTKGTAEQAGTCQPRKETVRAGNTWQRAVN